MGKRTTEKRRLIKFSNYSMCVTLPKWVIDQLEWKKGDQLTLVTDVKQGKITLFKEEPTQTDSTQEVKPGKPTPKGDTQPMPKLRW